MKPIEYISEGLVFNIHRETISGYKASSARIIAFSFLDQKERGKELFDFHEEIEIKPWKFNDNGCEITITNGGYSD